MIRICIFGRAATVSVAALLLSLAAPGQAQDTGYDCVLESKSTIELQSAEEGILDAVLIQRGDKVKRGQVVARLDSKQEALFAERTRLRAEGQSGVQSAKAQAEYRRKEVERLLDLRSTDAIPQREYATAVVESQLADIALESATMEQDMAKIEYEQAKSRLDRRSIRSPVDGIVVDVTMHPGEFVHEQATMMTIAEVNPLYVEMFMPVSEYDKVQKGMAAEVRPEAPIGGVHNAEVAVVDNVFDAASRTFRVRLVLPNEDYKLPAGLRCSVQFLEESDTANLALAE